MQRFEENDGLDFEGKDFEESLIEKAAYFKLYD